MKTKVKVIYNKYTLSLIRSHTNTNFVVYLPFAFPQRLHDVRLAKLTLAQLDTAKSTLLVRQTLKKQY